MVLAAVLLLTAAPAAKSDLEAFEQAVADVAQTWRSAAFALRTGSPRVAAADLARATDGWAALAARFAGGSYGSPDVRPDAEASLARVGDLLEDAREAALAGDRATGLASLGAIRMELGALEGRSDLEIFSTCIDQMNDAVEHLVRFRHDPPDLLVPGVVDAVGRRVALADYLAHRCYQAAPDAVRRDAGFELLFRGVFEALPPLPEAAAEGAGNRFLDLVRKIEGFNQEIFLKFG